MEKPWREAEMKEVERRIAKALKAQPDYRRLDSLAKDVWTRIGNPPQKDAVSFTIPMGLKMGSLALTLLAVFALSQISSYQKPVQADIFDLRYFSYHSAPSLNLSSINKYGDSQ